MSFALLSRCFLPAKRVILQVEFHTSNFPSDSFVCRMASSIPLFKMNNGLEMPALGLGTAQAGADIDIAGIEQAVKDSIDMGYRHFDSAFLYGTEAPVGSAVRQKIAEGVVKRENVFVTSKLWCHSMREDLVIPSLKQSLKALGLDYLDLYYIHWPIAMKENDTIMFFPDADGNPPPYSDADYVDTWKQMEECVKQGLTKSIGVSNFNSQQIQRILDKCSVKPVVNQVECHPYFNQEKLITFCKDKDIIVVAYSPLGAFGKNFMPGVTKKEAMEDERIKKIAEKHEKSAPQIALRWQIQRNVAVVPKSGNPKRMKENMSIFDFVLSDDDMNAIGSMNSAEGRILSLPWFKTHPNYPFDAEF